MAYQITYSGPWLGVNQWVNKNRWQQTAARNDIIPEFSQLIDQAQITPMLGFRIHLRYRSRHDVDNVSGGGYRKILQDLLIKKGLVPDDNPRYMRENYTVYDPTLANNTFVFTVEPVEIIDVKSVKSRK